VGAMVNELKLQNNVVLMFDILVMVLEILPEVIRDVDVVVASWSDEGAWTGVIMQAMVLGRTVLVYGIDGLRK